MWSMPTDVRHVLIAVDRSPGDRGARVARQAEPIAKRFSPPA
jgi:hypothetical protein